MSTPHTNVHDTIRNQTSCRGSPRLLAVVLGTMMLGIAAAAGLVILHPFGSEIFASSGIFALAAGMSALFGAFGGAIATAPDDTFWPQGPKVAVRVSFEPRRIFKEAFDYSPRNQPLDAAE